ncbi:membrane protein [Rhodopirellula sp. SWK7]|nr:membrane protein [Rhodopirellula sp. SWK7]
MHFASEEPEPNAETSFALAKNLFGKPIVRYRCAECNLWLRSPFRDAGESDQCPKCEAKFMVPGKDEVREAEQATVIVSDFGTSDSYVNRNYSIQTLMLVTWVFALLFAMPRLVGEISVSHWALLWIATLHQIALAATLSLLVWLLLGKRRSVAFCCAGVVLLLWGPNLAAATEVAIRGKAVLLIRFADATGCTATLNDFYAWTYSTIGYNMKVSSW